MMKPEEFDLQSELPASEPVETVQEQQEPLPCEEQQDFEPDDAQEDEDDCTAADPPHRTGKALLAVGLVVAAAVVLVGGYFVYESFISPKARFLRAMEQVTEQYTQPFETLTDQAQELGDILDRYQDGTVNAELSVTHDGQTKTEQIDLTVAQDAKQLTVSDAEGELLDVILTDHGIGAVQGEKSYVLADKKLEETLNILPADAAYWAQVDCSDWDSTQTLYELFLKNLRASWFRVGRAEYQKQTCTAYELSLDAKQTAAWLHASLSQLLKKEDTVKYAAQSAITGLFAVAQGTTPDETIRTALNRVDNSAEGSLKAVVYQVDEQTAALVFSLVWDQREYAFRLDRTPADGLQKTELSLQFPSVGYDDYGMQVDVTAVLKVSMTAEEKGDTLTWSGTVRAGDAKQLSDSMPWKLVWTDDTLTELNFSYQGSTGDKGFMTYTLNGEKVTASYGYYSAAELRTQSYSFDGTCKKIRQTVELDGKLTSKQEYDDAWLSYYEMTAEQANTIASYTCRIILSDAEQGGSIYCSVYDADQNGGYLSLAADRELSKGKFDLTVEGSYTAQQQTFAFKGKAAVDFRKNIKDLSLPKSGGDLAQDAQLGQLLERVKSVSDRSALVGQLYQSATDWLYENTDFYAADEELSSVVLEEITYEMYESVSVGADASTLTQLIGVQNTGTYHRYHGVTYYSYAVEDESVLLQLIADQNGKLIYKGYVDYTRMKNDLLKNVKRSSIQKGMTRAEVLKAIRRQPYYAAAENNGQAVVEQIYTGWDEKDENNNIVLAVQLENGVVTEIQWKE
ncbi:MAG: hypothetical protein IJC55_04700 [Clostridia bacterium]|nr:hypothetical protein [Clostridia bacterium]